MILERPTLYVLRDWTTALITGRHRARFLHAMLTAEVQKRAAPEAFFATMATSNGRHLGQVRIEVEDQAIVMTGAGTSVAGVIEGLRRHKVADDVKWDVEGTAGSVRARTATLALYGAGAAELIERALGVGLAVGRWAEVNHPEHGLVRVVGLAPSESELGRDAALIRVATSEAARLRVRLLAAGAEPLDDTTWDRRRIENGWPLDGVDLGEDDVSLASERIGALVSWSKGCFLGQEVFVMARDRGELPKKVRGVRGVGDPPPGGELFDGDKVVGKIGSTALSASGWLGLAMMKRKHAEPGTVVRLADGREARVVELSVH
jgi:folate-binding Fe-S cluster repair protein YgfZ